MSKVPQVSVVLPVYNAGKYLKESIQSILNQTFCDFELILIDDGSTDGSSEVIKTFKDERIRYLKNEKNQGLISTLNRGLSEARGQYIARMDADDIALPQRFEKQVHFLNKNLDYGVVGSYFKVFGAIELLMAHPSLDEKIQVELLFHGSVLGHPTVIIRKDLLMENKLNYDHNYAYAEDYKLWTDLIGRTKFYNIPEVLLFYRSHVGQVSMMHSKKQAAKTMQIKVELFHRLFGDILKSGFYESSIEILLGIHWQFSNAEEKKLLKLISLLKTENISRKILSRYYFNRWLLKNYFLFILRSRQSIGRKAIIFKFLREFLMSPIVVGDLLCSFLKSRLSTHF